MANQYVLCLALALLGPIAQADGPSWLKNGISKNGSDLSLVGNGTASTIELARKQAIKSCVASATDFMNTTYSVSSVTVQTEKDAALHESVSSQNEIRGMNLKSTKEYVDSADGSQNVSLLCNFDLSKMRLIPKDLSKEQEKSPYVLDSKKLVYFSSSPACDSIMVSGTKPRVVNCTNNPMGIILEPGDKELIIRSENFKPKIVPISAIMKKQSVEESYEVVLDR